MSWIEPWDIIERVALNDQPLDRVLDRARPPVRAVLDAALGCRELRVDEAELLLGVDGDDLVALVRTADAIRAADSGDVVTYVINRNINFTNVCFVNCQFCAFKRQRWETDAYTHSTDVVLAKVEEAIGRGATEICMQGGINPEMSAFAYRDVLVAIKTRFPALHVHAFSPMEIMYGARRTNMDYPAYIGMLRDHGLGSIPGTAAEILDDDVREILSHKKVDVRTWIDIITTAHRLGVPTTSTVMYGHVETAAHVARHLDVMRQIQRETRGFTEFVPLGFIWENTRLYHDGKVTPQPKGLRDLRMYATCRLVLRGLIDNLQTSWVKLGHRLSQLTLRAGCNDFGGTLMEESISREAGADAGEYTPADQIEALIRAMDRVPAQRTTLYGRVMPASNGSERGADGAPGESSEPRHGAGGWCRSGPVPPGPHPGH
jgi:FO synthase